MGNETEGGREMTKEELKKIPFRFRGHIALAKEHIAMYWTDDEQFGMEVHTPILKYGDFGTPRKCYRIGDKWYKSRKKFLEALEKV